MKKSAHEDRGNPMNGAAQKVCAFCRKSVKINKTKICNTKIITRLTNRSMAGFTFGASGFHDSKAFRVATLEDNSSGLKVNILKWT